MIYVVQNCSTLFEIQCAAKQLGSTFSMESGLINKYIRNYSENSKVYVHSSEKKTVTQNFHKISNFFLIPKIS